MSRIAAQQSVAFANPCLEAEQCANQMYRRTKRLGNSPWWLSVVLTVNVGEE